MSAPYTYKDPVSIHAPTKGATRLKMLAGCLVMVSIHAPTKGATIAAILTNMR